MGLDSQARRLLVVTSGALLETMAAVNRRIATAGVSKLEPQNFASLVMNDSICSAAFGYPLPRKARSALVHDAFQSAVAQRAVIYLWSVQRVADKLNVRKLQAEVKRCRESISFPTEQQFDIRWLRASLSGVPADKIHLVLEHHRRTLIDGALDAALWYLKDVPGGSARPAIVRFVCGALQEALATSDRDKRFDPATVLWALTLLLDSPKGIPSAFSLLNTFKAFSDRVLMNQWETAVPPNQRIVAGSPVGYDERLVPELYAPSWRSDCMCLYNLAKLRDVPSLKANARELATFYLQRIVDGSHLWDAKTDKSGLERRNLALLALSVRGLGKYYGISRPRAGKRKARVDIVDQTIEFNLGDHRGLGEYLMWNDGTPSAAREKVDQLKRLINVYVKSRIQRPLNILLSARPGAGKSFFVRNVIQSLGQRNLDRVKLIEVNASQLRQPIDVARLLRPLTSQIAEHGIGLFFLDEADTRIDNARFLFPDLLMPMWDGEYSSDGLPLYMKHAVLFFAMSAKDSADDTAAWLEEMKDEKGKDFASRIHFRYDLPAVDARARLLMFVGTLRRIHEKIRYVERGVLKIPLSTKFPSNAREIEKQVQMLRLSQRDENAPVLLWEDLPPALRTHRAPSKTHDRELVAITDY